jgi:hypothetical protein
MSRQEIQKLLGGYATDTLSEAERSALFAAAIEDQELFDALAKEQALRDVLQDPSARQQLIVALGPAPARRWLRWLRQPAVLAMAGGMAALLIVAGIVLRQKTHARREVMMADAIAPRPLAAIPPSAAPLKATEPDVIAHQPKRLSRLQSGGVLPAPQPAATAAPSPPPPPRAAPANGTLVDKEVPKSQIEITTGQSLVAPERAPMPAMGRVKARASAAANLAVEYTLLLKDADGAYSPVPSNIYLFQRGDATADWKLVASQRVERAQGYELPSTGGLQSDMPAQLELLLLLSRQEQPAFATPQTADGDALVSRARASLKIALEFR